MIWVWVWCCVHSATLNVQRSTFNVHLFNRSELEFWIATTFIPHHTLATHVTSKFVIEDETWPVPHCTRTRLSSNQRRGWSVLEENMEEMECLLDAACNSVHDLSRGWGCSVVLSYTTQVLSTRMLPAALSGVCGNRLFQFN